MIVYSFPPHQLLRSPSLGLITWMRVRSKEEIEEERRLMGFILQLERITHWKGKKKRSKKRVGKKELEWCSLTKLEGRFWRDERKERALGSALAQVDVHGKPGAWRGKEDFKKICSVLWVLLLALPDDSKDLIWLPINFLATSLFLHGKPSAPFLGLTLGSEQAGWLSEGCRGKCKCHDWLLIKFHTTHPIDVARKSCLKGSLLACWEMGRQSKELK